jgi:hypothetical protein
MLRNRQRAIRPQKPAHAKTVNNRRRPAYFTIEISVTVPLSVSLYALLASGSADLFNFSLFACCFEEQSP